MYKASKEKVLTLDTLEAEIFSPPPLPIFPLSKKEVFSELRNLVNLLDTDPLQTDFIIAAIADLTKGTGLDPASWDYMLSSRFFEIICEEFQHSGVTSRFLVHALEILTTASEMASLEIRIRLSWTHLYVSICDFYLNPTHIRSPTAVPTLSTLFAIFNKKFATVLRYVAANRFTRVVPFVCSLSVTDVCTNHHRSHHMAWDGIFYPPKIWLYLAFLAPLRRDSGFGISSVSDIDQPRFSVAVISALIGLTKVRGRKRILLFLEGLSPGGVAECLAVAWNACASLSVKWTAAHIVVYFLENAWGESALEDLRLVFTALRDVFQTITEDGDPRSLEWGLRFFRVFSSRGAVDPDEDREDMEFLVHLDTIQDERLNLVHKELLSYWSPCLIDGNSPEGLLD
jgi:hypothetical protein